jgi:predicted small lipoprotein YifL
MRRLLASACVLALLLAGCGQKGPLYLPDKKPAAVTPPAAAPAAPGATPAPAPAQPTQKKSDDTEGDAQPPK